MRPHRAASVRARASCASASRCVKLVYVVIDLSRHVAAGSRRGANSDFILERPWRDSASKGRVRRAEGPTSSASVPPRAPRETDVEKMACDQQRASTATRRSERAPALGLQPSYVFDNAPDLGAERPCDLFEAPARAIRRSSAHTRSRHAHFCRPGGRISGVSRTRTHAARRERSESAIARKPRSGMLRARSTSQNRRERTFARYRTFLALARDFDHPRAARACSRHEAAVALPSDELAAMHLSERYRRSPRCKEARVAHARPPRATHHFRSRAGQKHATLVRSAVRYVLACLE